ncbi:hypothetical protein FA95DRAFT_1611496 [Auriscalpium vulgare]|uniref:Uncharacterized protein n=1 Tax=Auriscalpium vulgare TaxID=40419 RepID=A0ACB8R9H4_9AGAM|nr:hypothetical protein FA95DRAFT_1611496 [Auriscalpium vulgare]
MHIIPTSSGFAGPALGPSIFYAATSTASHPVSVANSASAHLLINGGTYNILVNGDGLRLLNDPDRATHLALYETHGIGWVVCLPHSEVSATGDSKTFDTARRLKKTYNMKSVLALPHTAESCTRGRPTMPSLHRTRSSHLSTALATPARASLTTIAARRQLAGARHNIIFIGLNGSPAYLSTPITSLHE